MPELPPRAGARLPFADEVRRPAASERRAPDLDRRAVEHERRVVDPMAGFALEPLGRPEPRAEPRSEPAMPPRLPPRVPREPDADAANLCRSRRAHADAATRFCHAANR